MRNNIINSKFSVEDFEKITSKTNTKLIDFTSFVKKEGHTIQRGDIYSFANYGFPIKKIDNYRTISLASLERCQELIQEKFDESQKINVRGTLNKIKKWVKLYKKYIEEKNKEAEESALNAERNIELSIFSLIEKKHKTISFNDAYQSYRLVYCVPENEKGSIEDFKRYLDLNYLKIDEASFFKALL